MIFTDCCANCNGREDVRLYLIKFPERRQPTNPNFPAGYRRVAETGFMVPQSMDLGKPGSARTPDHEDQKLQAVRDKTGISTLQMVIGLV